jgi:hypothetical protein
MTLPNFGATPRRSRRSVDPTVGARERDPTAEQMTPPSFGATPRRSRGSVTLPSERGSVDLNQSLKSPLFELLFVWLHRMQKELFFLSVTRDDI